MMALSEDVFQDPELGQSSPLAWYQEAQKRPGFIRDDAQYQAILLLDELWSELMMFKRKRNRFLGRSLRSPGVPKGLYLYGGVGRGKSLLMDAFYGCLPYHRKRRMHFHAFMAEVHQRLKKYHGEENPLRLVAQDIAQEIRVLCFDEFHVSDIADAMILGRLLEGLFDSGVVLVATSNYEPSQLYPLQQNRSKFLPTIDLIQSRLKVLNVDGGTDYRLRKQEVNGAFYVPNSDEHEQVLQGLYTHYSGGKQAAVGEIEIMNRMLPVKGKDKDVIWFDFDVLCKGARSQNDYLQIAQQFRVVFLSHIPKLESNERNEARRFTWLIDVLYDYRVKLCATSAVMIDDIYMDGDFAHEFVRTASRLTEMQTQTYLNMPHLTL